MDDILQQIKAERERQIALAHGGDTDAFDKKNSRNDWIAYITAYAGDASDKVLKNERNGEDFRTNLVKVAALAIAAIEAHDKGYC
jgi:hypothetical protein